MLLKPTLSRNPESEPALDQKQLYDLGLKHVRRLSRRLWTDHNLHDPGITALELLCYALTDLAYRTRFPMQDLLATGRDNTGNMAAQFFTPGQILPNCPLTPRDYRKLMIDLPGVKNAWIDPAPHRVYGDPVKRTRAIDVKGLYRVRIEYADAADRNETRAAAWRQLHANRNLCEDFLPIEEVAAQPCSLCAELELETGADPIEIAAQIRFQVARYLAPPVRFHSLNQMLERRHPDGSPYTVSEIFEGPELANGFIDNGELDASTLGKHIHLSDIICIVMDIPGVRAVRDLHVNLLAQEKTAGPWIPLPTEDKWHLEVPEGTHPRLSQDHVRLVFYQRNFPVAADRKKVEARLQSLEREDDAKPGSADEDLPIPLGRYRDLARYRSFQQDFPALYGLSDLGLSGHASDERRAQVLQLKAYLLFFDQVMANYFAQLASLGSLFSRHFANDYRLDSAAARTCFAQRVESFRDFAQVYGEGVDSAKLAGLLEDGRAALERRNRILDHLLARCAEDFRHYAGIMHAAFGESPAGIALTKSDFLANYPALGAERGIAYDCSLRAPGALWNSSNVSGLERRLARLLGVADCSRRNLGSVAYQTYCEIDKTPGDEHRFRIRHAVSGKILLSSRTHYATAEAARSEMAVAIERAQIASSYDRLTTKDKKQHYFNVLDAQGKVVARRIEYFATPEAMDNAIEEIIAHLRTRYSGEGMYVIENLLLLPPASAQATANQFTPICTDPAGAACPDDPYSYRLHFVLPAYAGRFRNMDFRRFVEETIRQETPAHILPKVCWINEVDMAMLEQAYRDWLPLRAAVTAAEHAPSAAVMTEFAAKTQALIFALQHIKNVYPSRPLSDCGGVGKKPPFILGRTALGSDSPDA